MCLPSCRHKGLILLLGATLALSVPMVVCRADATGDATPDAAGQQTGAPASKLQVTGTADRFTVDADHADVQSTLKAIFDQAKKQFTIGRNVVGQVTLRLTDQPLATVLNAICQPTFLGYRLDKTDGIYHFETNDDAIRESFARLQFLNADLLQQLRSMGLNVPTADQFGFRGYPSPNGNVAGGFGGAQGPPGPNGPPPPLTAKRVAVPDRGPQGLSQSGSRDKTQVQAGPGGNNGPDTGQEGHSMRSNMPNGAARGGVSGIQTDYVDAAAALQMMSGANGQPQNPELYQRFLLQNNLVSYNTQNKEVPLTDVLEQLGKQAGVPVLIDPAVPHGNVFRINLVLPPRPLPEALNLLTYKALLEWRWIGNSIFITTTPSFKIFFGNTATPQVIYGVPPGYQLQLRGQQNGASQAPGGTNTQERQAPANGEASKGKGN